MTFPADLPWLEVFIFVLSITLVFTVLNYTVLSNDDERLSGFKLRGIYVPEQCNPDWQGEVLLEPSIKVLGTTHVAKVTPTAHISHRHQAQVPYSATVQPMDGCLDSSILPLLMASIEL